MNDISVSKIRKSVLCSVYRSSDEREARVSLEELERLLETAGGECVAILTQVREAPDHRTVIGSGKCEELAEICKNHDTSPDAADRHPALCTEYGNEAFQLSDRAADAPDLRMRRLHGCETAVEPDLSPCSDGGSLLPGPFRRELRDCHTGKLESPSDSVPALLKTVKRSK